MSTKDLLITVLILVLLATSIIFFVRSSTHRAAAEDAKVMSGMLVEYLQERDYHRAVPACKHVREGRFDLLTQCLSAVALLDELTGFFRETDYKQYNSAKNSTGFLVIQNERGATSYASEQFLLYFNNQPLVRGCAAPGEIAPGFTCRFDLEQVCEPGDNLEVQYEGRRVHLKTC